MKLLMNRQRYIIKKGKWIYKVKYSALVHMVETHSQGRRSSPSEFKMKFHNINLIIHNYTL